MGTRPTQDEMTSISRHLLQQWDQLEIHNDLLWQRFHYANGCTKLQLIVLHSQQQLVLTDLYAVAVGGYLEQFKILCGLRARFYWPSHAADVRTFCHTCQVCSARKLITLPRWEGLQTISTRYPMQIVATDILGPVPTTPAGNNYVLVAMDYFREGVKLILSPIRRLLQWLTSLSMTYFSSFTPPPLLNSQ